MLQIEIKQGPEAWEVYVNGEGPLERLAHSSRTVFIWGPFVVKIGFEECMGDAYKQNPIEYLTYSKVPPAVRRFLAEPFGYGFGTVQGTGERFSWIVQERIEGFETLESFMGYGCPSESFIVRDMIVRGAKGAIGDTHGANLGFRDDGRLVIVDYGFLGYSNNRDFLENNGIKV